MKNRFIMFLLLFLVLNVYFGWHVSVFLRSIGGMNPGVLFWIIFFLIAFSYMFGRSKRLPEPIRRGLKIVGSYYIALFEFAVILLPLADLAAAALYASGIPGLVSVRILGAIVLVILTAMMLYGSWNAWTPIVRTYELLIPKKAGDLSQLRVLVASDIHLGDIVGRSHLQRLVDRVKELRPDLILLPGDVIDDDINPYIRHHMSEVMRKLQAPLGVYAVLGNHEYYGGQIDEYIEQMRKVGVRVLRDENVLIRDSFYIVGRKDKAAESLDPAKRIPVDELLRETDRKLPLLLLDHQPYGFELAAAAGADVLLCGHTHRGQFFPNHWITRRLFELDWGYMQKKHMHVVVSSGFGTWGPPIRLMSRSEVIMLNIRFRS